jgi:hypothetical protein
MRKLMVLTLLASALLLFSTPHTANSCTDWDQDGVCAPYDCNDFNPTVGYDGDYDGDGYTVCSGDCMDDDPTVHRCGNVHQYFPVYYNPPEQPCQSGYNLHTNYFHCYSTGYCDPQPFMQTDEPYFRDCILY